MTDDATNPDHYRLHPSGVECITVTEHMGFCVGNAVKYIFRFRNKGRPIEDLRKCQWYISREIARRTEERWALFPDDERYEVSTAGGIRRKDTGRNRQLVKARNGYLTFLVVSPSGQRVLYYAHRAVARAFLGPCPPKHVVCHRDGVRSNNHLTNLRYDTQRGNLRDCIAHGTHRIGGNNPASKLRPEEVAIIRKSSASQVVLAREFGVSRSTIGRIRSGRAWADASSEMAAPAAAWLLSEPDGDVRRAASFLLEPAGATVRGLRQAAECIDREIARLEREEKLERYRGEK